MPKTMTREFDSREVRLGIADKGITLRAGRAGRQWKMIHCACVIRDPRIQQCRAQEPGHVFVHELDAPDYALERNKNWDTQSVRVVKGLQSR